MQDPEDHPEKKKNEERSTRKNALQNKDRLKSGIIILFETPSKKRPKGVSWILFNHLRRIPKGVPYHEDMKEKLRSDFNSFQPKNGNRFELFYYCDQQPPVIEPHVHQNSYEIQYFMEGDVRCTVNGQTRTLESGDIILIPPGVSHVNTIRPGKPYRRCIFWMSETFFGLLVQNNAAYGYLTQAVEDQKYFWHFPLHARTALNDRFIALLEASHSNRFGAGATMELTAASLVLCVNKAMYDEDHPGQMPEGQTLVEQLLSYVQTHLDEDLSLDTLAGRFFVSKYHISHRFKHEMGISLHQYILKKRLDQVRLSIASGQDLISASEQSGFRNYSSFFRAFQKEFGMSPTEYRKRRVLLPLSEESS